MLGQDPKQAELAAFLAPNINLSDAESSRIRELMKKVNDAVVEFAKASSEENERCLSNIPLHETEQDRWLELSDSLAATTRRAEAAEAEVSLLRAQLSAFESASTGALAPPPQQSPPLQSSPPSPSASVPPSSSLATTAGAGSPECAPDPSGVFGDCGETGLTAAEEAELSGLLSRKGGLITAVDRERVRELMTRAEAVATQQKELKELEDLMASANDKARGGLSLQQIERVKVLMQGEVERARGGGVPGPPSAGGASAAAAAAAAVGTTTANTTTPDADTDTDADTNADTNADTKADADANGSRGLRRNPAEIPQPADEWGAEQVAAFLSLPVAQGGLGLPHLVEAFALCGLGECGNTFLAVTEGDLESEELGVETCEAEAILKATEELKHALLVSREREHASGDTAATAASEQAAPAPPPPSTFHAAATAAANTNKEGVSDEEYAAAAAAAVAAATAAASTSKESPAVGLFSKLGWGAGGGLPKVPPPPPPPTLPESPSDAGNNDNSESSSSSSGGGGGEDFTATAAEPAAAPAATRESVLARLEAMKRHPHAPSSSPPASSLSPPPLLSASGGSGGASATAQTSQQQQEQQLPPEEATPELVEATAAAAAEAATEAVTEAAAAAEAEAAAAESAPPACCLRACASAFYWWASACAPSTLRCTEPWPWP